MGMNSSLSREALEVLELIPAWALRGAGTDRITLGAKGCAAMLVACDEGEPQGELLKRIQQAMVSAGWPAPIPVLIVDATGSDAGAIRKALESADPCRLFAFGRPAYEALDRVLAVGHSVVCLSGLADMISEPSKKKDVWKTLCESFSAR